MSGALADEALGAAMLHYHGYLLTVARRIVGWQDAEDAVAEAYLRCWRNRARIIPDEQGGNLGGLLTTSCYQAAIDMTRRSKARPETTPLEDWLPDSGAIVEGAYAEGARAAACAAAVATLPALQRELLWRRYWRGESVKEIITARGGEANTIGTQLYRARQALRTHLLAAGWE